MAPADTLPGGTARLADFVRRRGEVLFSVLEATAEDEREMEGRAMTFPLAN